MKNEKELFQNTPGGSAEIVNEGDSEDKKKKNIDEMIEQFNKDNPSKNQKRRYRGVL
ncbi:MAG: hypothetical protein P4N41_03810 [Negativicutes bacterium]|nr:hypothetical protein [Negativicutes bacterium]